MKKLLVFGASCFTASIFVTYLIANYSSQYVMEMKPGETRYLDPRSVNSPLQITLRTKVRRVDFAPKSRRPHKLVRNLDGKYYLVTSPKDRTLLDLH